MAMFKAFVDDSGSHEDSPHLVMAGYLASVSEWDTFSSEWASKMKEWGLPYFHMTDAEALRGHYKGWSTQERNDRIHFLASMIVGCTGACRQAITRRSIHVPRQRLSDPLFDRFAHSWGDRCQRTALRV